MNLVAMTIKGNVFLSDEYEGIGGYTSGVYMQAQGLSGLVSCQIILNNPKVKITTISQLAELHFYHVVQFPDGTKMIHLNAASKPIAKFIPLTISDIE